MALMLDGGLAGRYHLYDSGGGSSGYVGFFENVREEGWRGQQ